MSQWGQKNHLPLQSTSPNVMVESIDQPFDNVQRLQPAALPTPKKPLDGFIFEEEIMKSLYVSGPLLAVPPLPVLSLPE